MQLDLRFLQDEIVQPVQPRAYPALRQNSLPDAQVVRVEKPLDGILKNTRNLRLEIRKLTSIQNARELFFVVRRRARSVFPISAEAPPACERPL